MSRIVPRGSYDVANAVEHDGKSVREFLREARSTGL
jgi:hypothetical protein